MPVMGESSFEAAVQKVMREQQVSRKSAEKIVGSVEQKRARLLKLKLAALKKKRALIANHNHEFIFKGVEIGPYKVASLSQQMGRYAKYWLLNAKQVNGNGWGIAAHTAKENMAKFVGRPLVVTSAKWHGASEYGDKYEHPYLPTNDLNKIFDHQEKFRVGSIVDVQEDRHGDWYATIEMLPKFANFQLPPFCSPAIYQLDAKEDEGAISKWEALHLAALDENPAYGARIALLKGSCVGTANECKVQFKSAKQLNATIYDENVANDVYKNKNKRNTTLTQFNKNRKKMGLPPVEKQKEASIFDEAQANKKEDKKKKKMFDKNNARFRGIMEAQVVCPIRKAELKERVAGLRSDTNKAVNKVNAYKKKQKTALDIFESGDDGTLAETLNVISAGGADASKFKHQRKPTPSPTKKYRNLSNAKKDEVLGKVRENLLFNMNEQAGEFGFQTYEDTDNLLNFEDKKIDEDRFLGITKGKKVQNNGRKGTSLAKLKSKLAIVRSPDKFKVNREMKHTRVDSNGPLINKVPFGDEDRSTTQQYIDRQMRDSSYELSKGKKVYPPKPTQKDRKRIITAKSNPCHPGYTMYGTKDKNGSKVPNCVPTKSAKTKISKVGDMQERLNDMQKYLKHREIEGATEKDYDDEYSAISNYIGLNEKVDPRNYGKAKINPRLKKRLAKLAGLGEENMTYQKSKKVVIRKKKNYPKARKAQVEFDDPKAESKLTKISDEAWPTEQSTFLSSTGRFIGGGQDHTETIQKIFPKYTYTQEDKMDDGPVTRFSTQYKLPRVQRRMTRAGERISVGIHAPITNAQLKTLQDVEKMGAELGYVIGDIKTGEHGDGFSNMVKALREKKFL